MSLKLKKTIQGRIQNKKTQVLLVNKEKAYHETSDQFRPPPVPLPPLSPEFPPPEPPNPLLPPTEPPLETAKTRKQSEPNFLNSNWGLPNSLNPKTIEIRETER